MRLSHEIVYTGCVRKPRDPARLDYRRIEVVDEQTARVLRGKTGAERLRMASEMFSSARKMMLSALRSEHPDWDEEQLNDEAARRLAHGPR